MSKKHSSKDELIRQILERLAELPPEVAADLLAAWERELEAMIRSGEVELPDSDTTEEA